ncbi:MAG: pyridoxal-phosphate dependent enzyme [Sulfolobales archaeon]
MWYCPECGFTEDIWRKYYYKCPRCGAPLDVRYDVSYETRGGRGFSRFESMLPFVPEKSRGEGSTPLVIEKEEEVSLLFKLEYLNPSGSFKDRGTALSIYYARRLGFENIVEDTSGNTGISVALYSKLYGMKSRIVMPRTAPEGKKKLVRMLGGEIIETETRSEASEKVLSFLGDSYYVAHLWSPFYIIGASTIAYEVFEEYSAPDAIIAPVGSGGLILGIIRGFENLLREGRIRRMPRPIAVQGYSSQPLYVKIHGERVIGEDSSLADGIMVQNPPRLNEIASKIREYNGEVVLVGNSDIRAAWNLLLERGFLVEPTSATVYAAYMKIRKKLEGLKVLLPLTGSGLKM